MVILFTTISLMGLIALGFIIKGLKVRKRMVDDVWRKMDKFIENR